MTVISGGMCVCVCVGGGVNSFARSYSSCFSFIEFESPGIFKNRCVKCCKKKKNRPQRKAIAVGILSLLGFL